MTLYKYIDEHIFDVLEKNSLKFTTRDTLNDPFELFPFFEPNEFENNNLIPESKEEEFQKIFIKTLPDTAFDLMTESEWLDSEKNNRNEKNPYKIRDPINGVQNYYNDLTPGLISILNNYFGILCLTEDPLSITMWSHYGNNNKGFVIGFETSNDFFYERENPELRYRNLRKVNYKKVRPIVKNPFNVEELNETFFCKSNCWSGEEEWRVIRRLDDADEVNLEISLYLFKFNPVIINEIYFGLGSNIESRNRIIDIIKSKSNYQNIKIYQIDLDKNDFKLIPKIVII